MREPLSPATSDPQVRQDRGDLRRGALVNGMGALFKVAVPAMTALSVRLYGAEAFGLFIVTQAALLGTSRVCLVGLDKALLWWIPQQRLGQELRVWRSVVTTVVVTAGVGTLLLVLLAESVIVANGGHGAALTLRVMALSLLPMTLMELLLAACTGLKRMGPNVVVKETLLPICVAGFGLLLYPLGLGVMGLALAFTAAYVCMFGIALVWWRKLFAETVVGPASGLPPARLRRYALPMWFAELSNSLLLRLDVYAVAIAANGDMRMVGIYGAAVTIANGVRQIRRSFDPIVLVLTAEIGADSANRRLRAGFSYATTLVMAAQVPVLAIIVGFAPWLMQFFGEAFGAGTAAVVVLSTVWVINSPFSLAGVVVLAHGHAKLTLANVWLAIGVQAVALWLLVPSYGLLGAAWSVGIAYGVQAIVQVVQMRWVTRAWNVTTAVARPLGWGVAAGLVGGGLWAVLPDPDQLGARVAIVAASLAVYGGGMLRRATVPRPPTRGAVVRPLPRAYSSTWRSPTAATPSSSFASARKAKRE